MRNKKAKKLKRLAARMAMVSGESTSVIYKRLKKTYKDISRK